MDDGLNTQFEKFTERARKTLQFAQDETLKHQHAFIGTEHLLLGLLDDDESVATQILRRLKVQPDDVRAAVENIIGRGDRLVLGEVKLTARSKRSLQLAVDEARQMGHQYVGTEHLLLGLIREREGIAAQVLTGQFGITYERARASFPATSAPKSNVVTCRLDDAAVSALDALVEAGIRSTRSDAAAWLINAGIASHRELFDRVNATVNEIRKLRLEARDIARQVANGAEGAQDEEPGDSGQSEEPPKA